MISRIFDSFKPWIEVNFIRLKEFLLDAISKPLKRALLFSIPIFFFISLLNFIGVFRDIDLFLEDLRFLTRDKICEPLVDPDLMTIDWDETSIQTLGRWPWSWERHAALVQALEMFEAETIGFSDDHFSQKDPITLQVDAAYQLSDKINEVLKKKEDISGVIPHPIEDLKSAMKSAGRVQVCADFSIPEKIEELQNQDAIVASGDAESIKRFGIEIFSHGLMPNARRVKTPIPEIAEVAAGIGFNRILHDGDGVVRHTPAIILYDGKAYLNLGLSIAARKFGITKERIKIVPGHSIEFEGARYSDGKKVNIPIDKHGLMALNWVGPYNYRIPHIPFLVIAEHYAFIAGKSKAAELQFEPDNIQPFFSAVYDSIMNTKIVSEEEAQILSWTIIDGEVAEYFIRNGKEYENFFNEYLGGKDSDQIGLTRWNIVKLNISALSELQNGVRPDYKKLLTELKLKDSIILRKGFEQMLYMYDHGYFDQLTPPLFITTPIKQIDGREIEWSPLQLKGKTIFIGLTATALHSLNPTPYEKRSQMFGIQPTVYNTVMTGGFIHEAPSWLTYALIFVYSLITVFLVTRFGTLLQIIISSISVLGYAGLAWGGFARYGIVLPITPPIISIVFSHLTGILYNYWSAQKEKRKVRGLFSAMISPTILKLMEENPDNFKLAGERKEATMFSSDVSGFTTISEGVTAQELAGILNSYLTPMSNIIMKYDGFADKYEGDAIKAEFGVPITDSQHALKGVFAAMEQQEELIAIARMILLKYGVKITARMGVNSGIVSAGNMGSERRMQYTVMGEGVALAEELEPINKLYESWIAISGETEKNVQGSVICRLLDVAAMGPSHLHISVYEPLGWSKAAYLLFWSGKPIHPLFFEGWRNMTPEKLLGYHYYFAQKGESGIGKEIQELFGKLKNDAVDAMKSEDSILVSNFEKEINSLEEKLSITATKNDVHAKIESDSWKIKLDEWKKRISKVIENCEEIRDSFSKDEYDDLMKRLDALEKRTACFVKRCNLSGSEVENKLSDNLKSLICRENSEDIEKMKRNYDSKVSKIRHEIDIFLGTLRDIKRAEAFHEYFSTFREVSDKHLLIKDKFEEARQHYLKRNWVEAEKVFREILKIEPQDGPSIKYIERIAELRKNPPETDWDGVWIPE